MTEKSPKVQTSKIQLKPLKIRCTEEHFKAISNGEVVYRVVDSYDALLDIVTK